MDEYTPCKKADPTAQEAIGNVMRETRHRITGSRRRKALSKDMRTRVYEMYGGHCAYCGREIDITEMQVDHVQAVYLGGGDEMANYRPACRQCNFYKSTMSTEGLRSHMDLYGSQASPSNSISRSTGNDGAAYTAQHGAAVRGLCDSEDCGSHESREERKQ